MESKDGVGSAEMEGEMENRFRAIENKTNYGEKVTSQVGGRKAMATEDESRGRKREQLPWLPPILQESLCHLFQHLTLEGDRANVELANKACTMYVCTCIC